MNLLEEGRGSNLFNYAEYDANIVDTMEWGTYWTNVIRSETFEKEVSAISITIAIAMVSTPHYNKKLKWLTVLIVYCIATKRFRPWYFLKRRECGVYELSKYYLF